MAADSLIFCTSCLELDPQRYRDWIDYYSSFFAAESVDLLLVNDGPAGKRLDLKRAGLVDFAERLGRSSVYVFPGWKRSFLYGLCRGVQAGYRHTAHVESDCWITSTGKKEFLQKLRAPGYFTGYTRTHHFPETALQILNDRRALDWLLRRYARPSAWWEDLSFEGLVERELRPAPLLAGDRHEGEDARCRDGDSYLANCSYQDFKRLRGSTPH
jgi:hypothetical protein